MTIQTEVNAKIHAQSEILTHNNSVRDVKESSFLCNMPDFTEPDISSANWPS